ncbi:hypothetical protein CQA66_07750 [Helicobacter aurati]|uniref:DNA2/NAM7 helicase-like C-terminal domain-containing protein n=1 Tax=Helicobacter aurati TaxID=137778 RepID=A0A3D8J1J2_9HELI|nr:AAA domain-containing protein [Helicobacter aurati]RDU70724.1 hypothetical protein CQA66_07750 [Helicobacter aurati]
MSTLHDYIIKSAQDYLAYLEENNLGREEIKITKAIIHSKNIPHSENPQETRQQNTLILSLEQPLLAVDYLQLSIGSTSIDLDSYEKKHYNELTRTLHIPLTDTTLQTALHLLEQESDMNLSNTNTLDNNIAKYLKLFVDLKFLVSNILSFCQQKLHLALPSQKPLSLTIPLDSYINVQQQKALKGIFSSPMSYIWGISGSGKTQVVLFFALLNIIMQQKKALILAPTNTALEQIFTALITKCDVKGIAREKFLRLGMPSHDFLQHYPEVCIHTDEEESKQAESTKLFASPNLKDRLQECLVIGLTLDSFVKRYQILSTLNFAHIFLDECAFSPLIKLIAPLQLNIPLTLLGDHKQLMPICLMDTKTISAEKHEVCLWNLNALFIESLLRDHTGLHHAHNHDEITFQNIAHYKLTVTHRYGNNLAQILDGHVYCNGLQGKGEQTEIYFIDSKQYGKPYHYATSSNNENIAEANAIMTIINDFADYAVLTPFRDQQKLLLRKGVPRNRVFTIHKSQGKEFDCIIFSPVKFSMFMTNSMNKGALFALNVAISRLKKKLIIVCDYNFWLQKKGQLIASLLQIAKPYNKAFATKLIGT